MDQQRESIFKSALRSLFSALFGVIGVGFGILALIVLVAVISESSREEVERENKIVVLPDADGEVEPLAKETPVLLQVDIEGVIGIDELEAEDIRTQLRESRIGDLKGDRIKGVLLYINTPGGGVVDADGIYRAIKDYKQRYKVPVYAYVDGLCASGGMYIASAADKIYTTDSSLIGSVGVLIPTAMNFSKVLEALGIETKTITAGKDKDALNPFRPWKPEEAEMFQNITDYYYGMFVNIVTEARPNLDKKELVDVYGARVFPAPEAQSRGYIDIAGADRSSALRDLAAASNISEGTRYQVVRLKEKNWLKKLLRGNNVLFSGKVRHEVGLPGELDPRLQGKFLYLYRPE